MADFRKMDLTLSVVRNAPELPGEVVLTLWGQDDRGSDRALAEMQCIDSGASAHVYAKAMAGLFGVREDSIETLEWDGDECVSDMG